MKRERPCLFCPSERSGRKSQWKLSRRHTSVFFLTCRESDRQARGHLPAGARRRAMVGGASTSSEHPFRWDQAPGGSEEPSPKSPLVWEIRWGHKESPSSDTLTVPSQELYPCIDFLLVLNQSKYANLFNKVNFRKLLSPSCHPLSWCLPYSLLWFLSDDFILSNLLLNSYFIYCQIVACSHRLFLKIK